MTAARLSVLHIGFSDRTGGAAESAYKIHSGLRALGIESRMLVAEKATAAAEISAFPAPGWKLLDRPFRKLTDALGLQYVFLPSSLSLLAHPWVRASDVIQVYNTHGGYLSHLILAPLSRYKPVVWRLMDLWALTGHCAYSYLCERWRTGCGHCPDIATYPGVRRDMTAANWRIKRFVYGRSRLHLSAPSRWLAALARESPLLGSFPMSWIPESVDVSMFRPSEKVQARKALGLPINTRLLFFIDTEARKGRVFLEQALEIMRARGSSDLHVVVIGGKQSNTLGSFPSHQLEFLSDQARLALVYSAADLFVLPSLADNLPNTVMESLSCGTPVVAFDVGGISDAVRHLQTGFLARAGDSADLAAGLMELLDNEALRIQLGSQARRVVEADYSLESQANRFAALYEQLLTSQRAHTNSSPGPGD